MFKVLKFSFYVLYLPCWRGFNCNTFIYICFEHRQHNKTKVHVYYTQHAYFTFSPADSATKAPSTLWHTCDVHPESCALKSVIVVCIWINFKILLWKSWKHLLWNDTFGKSSVHFCYPRVEINLSFCIHF